MVNTRALIRKNNFEKLRFNFGVRVKPLNGICVVSECFIALKSHMIADSNTLEGVFALNEALLLPIS